MFTPYDDPVVKRKHLAQQEILKKAGDVTNYSKTIKDEVTKLRNKFPGKFPKALEFTKPNSRNF